MRKIFIDAIAAFDELQKTAKGRKILKRCYIDPMKKFLNSEPSEWKLLKKGKKND